jgi:hypothetical protein
LILLLVRCTKQGIYLGLLLRFGLCLIYLLLRLRLCLANLLLRFGLCVTNLLLLCHICVQSRAISSACSRFFSCAAACEISSAGLTFAGMGARATVSAFVSIA